MHISRARTSIHGGQRADRVQTVEEEMRIDLRLEGLQFRLLRQRARFLLARFGFLRRFHRQQNVVQRDSQQVEQNADAEQQRKLRTESLIEMRELGGLSPAPGLWPDDPKQGDDDCGGGVIPQQLQKLGATAAPAEIPGRQADERVESSKAAAPGIPPPSAAVVR